MNNQTSAQKLSASIKIVLIVSLLLNAGLIFNITTPYFTDRFSEAVDSQAQRIQQLTDEVANLKEVNNALEGQLQFRRLQVENLTGEVENLRRQQEFLQSQLNFYKSQAEFYANLTVMGNARTELKGSSTINLVAVRTVPRGPFEAAFQGVTMQAEVELKPGEGRILINTEPQVGIDLQVSTRTAAKVAETITAHRFSDTDIVLTVRAEEEVDIVDGPSAGAAITAALIAAIENQTFNPSAYITGTINADGTIGTVGGIVEKALAAAQRGATLFLVPEGQSVVQIYTVEKKEVVPGFTVITRKPVKVNLDTLLQEEGFNLQVIEVRTIEEAYALLKG